MPKVLHLVRMMNEQMMAYHYTYIYIYTVKNKNKTTFSLSFFPKNVYSSQTVKKERESISELKIKGGGNFSIMMATRCYKQPKDDEDGERAICSHGEPKEEREAPCQQ